ncbi:MAG TPA: DUF2255 family protein [Coriobacteriia bacterium]|nr:DUF2255 family protein [Coriobacteriia bacterium]
MTRSRFDSDVTDAVQHDLVIGIRAGDNDHRFTPVWSVVVGGRVFIRSWALSDRSWFSAFRDERVGVVQIAGVEYPVRANLPSDNATLDAVDEAYRLKYHTPSSAQYVTDINSARSRATTTELMPAASDKA